MAWRVFTGIKLFIYRIEIYTGGAVSFEKGAFAWDYYFDERKRIIAAFCVNLGNAFFLSNIFIYRYNAVFTRLHGEMMGVANCRGLMLGNKLYSFFGCMIMMGRAIDGASNVAIRIHTAYAATISLFYLESPNFFSVGNLN